MQFPSLHWPANEIRLLRLLPAATDHEAVRCELQVFSINELSRMHDNAHSEPSSFDLETWRLVWDNAEDAVAMHPEDVLAVPRPNVRFSWGYYIALSYVWGDGIAQESVYVNGHRVNVRKNLVDALKAIRAKVVYLADAHIWADSLCIDQADVNDRNRHVSLMRNIYANAGQVVVWLGEEHSHSGLAFDMIYTLGRAWEHGNVGVLMEENLQSQATIGTGSWLALLNLMDREYWTRVWVIQELCLGSSSMPILCGRRAIPWRLLYTAIWRALYQHQDKLLSLINKESLQIRQAPFQVGHKDLLRRSLLYHINVEQLLHLGPKEDLSVRNRENTKDGWHIMPILDLARRSNATLGHDRIYGLMGLLPTIVRRALKPEYGLPVEDVFVSFAKAWIHSRGDLEILSQCIWTGVSDLPSWTPDWRHQEHLRLFGGANVPYHACDDTNMTASFSEDDSTLTLRGIPLDTIDGLGAILIGERRGTPEFAQAESMKNRYESDEKTTDALWRTLVGNITTAGHRAPDAFESLLSVPLHGQESVSPSPRSSSVRLTQFREFILASAELRIGGRALASYFDNVSGGLHSQEFLDASVHLESALEQAFRFSRLKRLATTIGGCLAMVPNATSPGDVVCAFPGSNVPIVVRRLYKGDSPVLYHVVGACYIHGYMEGEAINEVNHGTLQFENINLV